MNTALSVAIPRPPEKTAQAACYSLSVLQYANVYQPAPLLDYICSINLVLVSPLPIERAPLTLATMYLYTDAGQVTLA